MGKTLINYSLRCKYFKFDKSDQKHAWNHFKDLL